MSKDVEKLLEFYKKEVTRHIPDSLTFEAKEQFLTFASFFSPGAFYFYILNFDSLKMEYTSPGIKKVLGIEPEDFSLEKLLKVLTPEALIMMQKKEKLVGDFLFNFLKPEEIREYKVVYMLKIKDARGTQKSILHQVSTLTTSETGKVRHVLGVHTDITDWKVPYSDRVSLIHIDGGTSYYHLDPEKEKFDPSDSRHEKEAFSNSLTKKEIEIIRLLIKGLTGKEIAEEFNISTNTVRTHRNNILRKTGCSDTPELVTKSIMQGII